MLLQRARVLALLVSVGTSMLVGVGASLLRKGREWESDIQVIGSGKVVKQCQPFDVTASGYKKPPSSCYAQARARFPQRAVDDVSHKLADSLQIAASLSCEPYVNVVLVSNSQNCFLDNYVTNINKLDDGFPAILSVAADIGAHEACLALAQGTAASRVVLVCAKSPTMSNTNIVLGKDDYGTANFAKVAWQKTTTIKTALGLGITIMLTDIDMIWHYNPSPYFLYSPTIIETQCHRCEPADNLGIVFAAPGTEAIIKIWDDEKRVVMNDNDAFRQAMVREQKKQNTPMTRCLPRNMFGFSMGAVGVDESPADKTHDWMAGAPKRKLLTHFIATVDKISAMKEMKFWTPTKYGEDTCTLKSGVFTCDQC